MKESFRECAYETEGKETPLLRGQGGIHGLLCSLGSSLWVSTGPALPAASTATLHLFPALKIHPERTFFFFSGETTNLSSWPPSRTL